jgi:nicotinate-nucleotide adenylyltransferase
MNIALFGGSFDPIHLGHIEIIKKINLSLDVDKIIVLPTFLNPFKTKSYANSKKRLEWLQDSLVEFENVEICNYEINNKKPTPTIDSVKYIKSIYDIKKIYLIIGADNLQSLSKWYKYDELNSLVEFVIATRDNIEVSNDKKVLNVDIGISSTKIRENLDKEYLPIEVKDDIIEFYKKRKLMEKRIENIVNVLDSKKAEHIQSFDLKDSDYFMDYVVIATTLNNKHGIALLDYLKNELKPLGEEFLNVDEDDNWVVIDLGDILIHLMNEEYRAKYNLEEFLSNFDKQK